MSDHSHKPIMYLTAGLLFFVVFQFTQILVDRGQLEKAKAATAERIAQADKVLADSQKMLDQLNNIATGTQRLADAGNPNAKDIVAQLNRMGIKINPNYKEDQAKAAAAAAAKASGKPEEMKDGKPAEAPAAAPAPEGKEAPAAPPAPPAPAPEAPPAK